MLATQVPTIDKVVAYIVRDERLAVFLHEGDFDPVKESGLQVPAGSCEPGEVPAEAVLREAWEESGLDALRVVRYLGDTHYDMRPYANATHHRRFFHLAVDGPVGEEWSHVELHARTDKAPVFQFFWMPLRQAHVLAAGQGALLGSLSDSRTHL